MRKTVTWKNTDINIVQLKEITTKTYSGINYKLQGNKEHF